MKNLNLLLNITTHGPQVHVNEEFTGTSYAKYGKIKWDGLGRKSANSSFKNVGYILTTYFK